MRTLIEHRCTHNNQPPKTVSEAIDICLCICDVWNVHWTVSWRPELRVWFFQDLTPFNSLTRDFSWCQFYFHMFPSKHSGFRIFTPNVNSKFMHLILLNPSPRQRAFTTYQVCHVYLKLRKNTVSLLIMPFFPLLSITLSLQCIAVYIDMGRRV